MAAFKSVGTTQGIYSKDEQELCIDEFYLRKVVLMTNESFHFD